MFINDRNIKLVQVFGFSETELQTNREGKLSEAQSQTLGKIRQSRVVSMAAYAVMLLLFLAICVGSGIWILMTPGRDMSYIAVPLAMGFAMLLILGGAANYFLRTREMLTGKVSHIEGPAKLYTRSYSDDIGYGTVWSVTIGSIQFKLPNQAQYAAFEEGSNYRFYYVKNYPINFLLSVEAL